MTTPLAGLEVIDLATPTPGKYAAFLLAELGAAVVRIERPGAGFSGEGGILEEDRVLNRGKRSLVLDLRRERGRRVLHRLAARADVLIECYRPGVAERLGAGWAELSAVNRRLVLCSLSGFGQEGPARSVPAYDLLFAGWSGLLSALFGTAAPRVPGTYLADGVSGLTATLAIVVALLERERTGSGRQLDLAMLDSAFALLAVSHGMGPARAEPPRPREPGRPDRAPSSSPQQGGSPLYAIYGTADGRRVALAALRPSSVRALLDEIGRPDLADRAVAGERDEELGEALRHAFGTATAAEWIERLRHRDVEIGPVHRPEEAFADPQLLARGLVEEPAEGEADARPLITSALRPTWRRAAGDRLRPAPLPGQDADELLLELGYTPAETETLRRDGTI